MGRVWRIAGLALGFLVFAAPWVAIIALLASCSRDEDYHDTVKPPAAYAGCKPKAAYVYSDHVDNLCARYLGRVARGRYRGCYVPATNTIILPVKPWPTLIRHEEAHACGWRHA